MHLLILYYTVWYNSTLVVAIRDRLDVVDVLLSIGARTDYVDKVRYFTTHIMLLH